MKKIELTQEQINDIQEKYRNNVKVEELCNEYKVTRKIIYKYTKGLYGAPRIRNAVNLAGSADEIKALLRSLLG